MADASARAAGLAVEVGKPIPSARTLLQSGRGGAAPGEVPPPLGVRPGGPLQRNAATLAPAADLDRELSTRGRALVAALLAKHDELASNGASSRGHEIERLGVPVPSLKMFPTSIAGSIRIPAPPTFRRRCAITPRGVSI